VVVLHAKRKESHTSLFNTIGAPAAATATTTSEAVTATMTRSLLVMPRESSTTLPPVGWGALPASISTSKCRASVYSVAFNVL
jgi:hypothetical protein